MSSLPPDEKTYLLSSDNSKRKPSIILSYNPSKKDQNLHFWSNVPDVFWKINHRTIAPEVPGKSAQTLFDDGASIVAKYPTKRRRQKLSFSKFALEPNWLVRQLYKSTASALESYVVQAEDTSHLRPLSLKKYWCFLSKDGEKIKTLTCPNFVAKVVEIRPWGVFLFSSELCSLNSTEL